MLRVITYNIHKAIGVDRRFRPQRIVDILRHYDADVVTLQEVDDGVPRSRELDGRSSNPSPPPASAASCKRREARSSRLSNEATTLPTAGQRSD